MTIYSQLGANDEELNRVYKELIMKKKKIVKKMEATKKKYLGHKMEKRRVNKELKELFEYMKTIAESGDENAKKMAFKDIENVTTEDIAPKDLEKEFEKIDRSHDGKRVTVELDDFLMDNPVMEVIAGVEGKDLESEFIEKSLNDGKKDKSEEDDEDDIKLALEDESASVGFGEHGMIVDEEGEFTLDDEGDLK